MRKITLIILLAGFTFSMQAQSVARKAMSRRLDSIVSIMSRIPQMDDDSVRIAMGDKTADYMQEIMMHPSSWGFDLSSLKQYMSILEAPDKSFRIITWGIPLISGDYKYYGFIQRYDKKKKTAFFYRLYDKSDDMENPERPVLTPENWYGCIYYDIKELKVKRKKVYVLLGTDPANDLVNRKIVEVLYFTGGKPRFGADLPDEKGRIVRRLIFTYNNEAQMVLRWDDNLGMIVFDHLSPSKPKFKGLYQYYGPDFSYDGLKLERGKWIYVKDIDVRNPKKD